MKIQQVGAALVLASLAWPARAAELTASAPPECADASELSFRVERRMGMPLAQAAPLAFDVVMERTAVGYVAHIGVTESAPGAPRLTRELSAADCGKLVDAVSVALAFALGAADASPDAEAASSTVRADPARATSAASPAAAAPPAPVDGGGDEDNSSVKTRPALLPSISLWLLGDAGSLPSPSLGAAIGVELGWSQLELRAIGTVLFEQETQLDSPSTPSPGAKLQQLARFEGRSSLRTWLFAILQRVAANHRRMARRKLKRLVPLAEEIAAQGPTPHARAEAVEAIDMIQRFCDTLDMERRAVFVLALLEELPAPEVAQVLEIPINTVYSRVRSLRDGLRRALEGREVEHD